MLDQCGKCGGGLIGGTAHRECDRVRKLVTVSEGSLTRRCQQLDDRFQERVSNVKEARAQRGATRHTGAEQLSRPREFGGFLAQLLRHRSSPRRGWPHLITKPNNLQRL